MLFHFAKGSHTIRLAGIKESPAVSKITLSAKPVVKSYSDYNSEYPETPGKDSVFIEAEEYYEKSDYGIVRYQDRSSAFSTPQDPYKIRLNVIGGSKWHLAGQAVSGEIPIKTEGRY